MVQRRRDEAEGYCSYHSGFREIEEIVHPILFHQGFCRVKKQQSFEKRLPVTLNMLFIGRLVKYAQMLKNRGAFWLSSKCFPPEYRTQREEVWQGDRGQEMLPQLDLQERHCCISQAHLSSQSRHAPNIAHRQTSPCHFHSSRHRFVPIHWLPAGNVNWNKIANESDKHLNYTFTINVLLSERAAFSRDSKTTAKATGSNFPFVSGHLWISKQMNEDLINKKRRKLSASNANN